MHVAETVSLNFSKAEQMSCLFKIMGRSCEPRLVERRPLIGAINMFTHL